MSQFETSNQRIGPLDKTWIKRIKKFKYVVTEFPLIQHIDCFRFLWQVLHDSWVNHNTLRSLILILTWSVIQELRFKEIYVLEFKGLK